MIPLLVWHKRFAAKKAAELTPSRVAQALAEREAAWTHGEARFAGAISYASAVKSLKAIARDHPALRPHFRMAPAQGLAPAEVDPPAALDYDAAARCRDRGLLVTTAIRLALDPEDAGVASTLDLVTTILAACPPKPYKYVLYVTLSGVDFGPGTLRTLPAEDLLARERLAARLPLLARMSLECTGAQRHRDRVRGRQRRACRAMPAAGGRRRGRDGEVRGAAAFRGGRRRRSRR